MFTEILNVIDLLGQPTVVIVQAHGLLLVFRCATQRRGPPCRNFYYVVETLLKMDPTQWELGKNQKNRSKRDKTGSNLGLRTKSDCFDHYTKIEEAFRDSKRIS